MWPERFAKAHPAPLVERVLRGFVSHGFARALCQTCGRTTSSRFHVEQVLVPVPHRHVVLTMPRLLRPLFRKRRELLDELAHAGAQAVSEAIQQETGEAVRPGLVISIATAGDLSQWHPHLHILATDGGFAAEASFQEMLGWDAERLMKVFRERLLQRLVAKHAISVQLVHKLATWRHPGFSAHVGEPIRFEDKQALDDVASYMVRNAVSLKRLIYIDGHQAVLYRGKMNPGLGRNFEAMEPLE